VIGFDTKEGDMSKVDGVGPFRGEAPRAKREEAVAVSRIQLVLAEKRTSLAVMRTGIGVFTLPLSVVTVLVATSRYYDFLEAFHFLVPLLILCAGLVALAIYLVHRSRISIIGV
jgi:hypothetical protein